MKKLSFVVSLVVLVPFCAAQNNEFGNHKELNYPRNVDAIWKKFMARLLKNIRTNREATKREFNLQLESSVTVEPQDEDVGKNNNDQKNDTKAVSCNQASYCSVSETVTASSHQSSSNTGTSNSSSNNSNSNSNSSNSSTSTGGGTATSSNNSSSSSSSSSG